MHFTDKVFDHLFGDVEFGNHAIAQRANGLNVTGRTPEHLLSFFPDGKYLFLAFFVGDGYHGWFVKDDATPFDVNQCVGGAQIHRHVGG